MDDLGEKISKLLSSPDAMEKIQSAMAAFGVQESASQAASSPLPPAPAGGLPDLNAIAKLAPLLSSMGQDNNDTRLLQALRPYLHGERAGRLDETMRLLRLLRLLPMLQESGLGNLLSQGGNNHGG
ncbi:MAG: hypothetical protein IIW40_02605 [Clostridia bacterium]|nr:hypothetical protein [Clostridia bacterium]